MNLANVPRSDLTRGNVVVVPGQVRTTQLFDARIDLLADAPRPLLHNTQVDLYIESQEIPAKVRLLDVEELQPGKSAWVQLRLNVPAVLARRDRFILRIPSPSMTIGGGEVVDVTPRYHKRFQTQVVSTLERLSQGTPEELVLAALDRRTVRAISSTSKASTKVAGVKQGLVGYELTDVAKQSNLAVDVTLQILETLLSEGRVKRVGTSWFAQHIWELLVEEAVRLVEEQHQQYPLRSGLSKEEWRSRLNLTSKMANDVFAQLQSESVLEVVADTGRTGSGLIRLPGFTPRFTGAQQQQVERVLRVFAESPYTPPVRSEADALASAEVITALIEQGRLIKLGDGVLFLQETYTQALTLLVDYLRTHTTVTVAEARDILGASRKYILPLLEHMDALHITRRTGDVRILGTTPFPTS
jgi:selenocysteine-specific elongation factor